MAPIAPTTWEEFQSSTWIRARREGIPLAGTLELTPLCNFRCRMCYVRLDALPARARLRGAREWLELARQASARGTYAVTLTGGEPLTHPEFATIYQGLAEMGLLVSVLSNGSLVTSETVQLFQDYPPASLRVTLYGSSNQTYARLCSAPDGFDRVMSSLRTLAAAGVPLMLAFTRTRLNESDLDDVTRIARDLGAPLSVGNDLIPAVRGATSEARDLRVPRAERIAPDVARTEACKAPEGLPRPGTALPADLLEGPFGTCASYRTSFHVTWDGRLELCSLMSGSRARPFETGFDDAWHTLLSELGRIQVPERCLACEHVPYCTACPGRREAETGDVEGVSPLRCEEARALRDSIVSAVGR